ncbi:MAG: toprim domain-containing protein [Flavobacteriales bacterium]|nr:toprim domain-containing protein [Flavobacteriales bacterium]
MGYNATGYKDLKNCLVFPLRNKENQIVSLYGRSITKGHYYTSNRKGLYPKYLPAETKKLILTESIIDAATLLQNEVITNQYEVLALYGTNGLTSEHIEAIKSLKLLEDIVLFLDGDAAGEKAAKKYAEQFKMENEELKISIVQTPKDEDINSLLDGHEAEIFTQLLQERTIFSSADQGAPESNNKTEELKLNTNNQTLDTNNPERIIFKNNCPSGSDLTVTDWGGIEKENLSRLRVSLHITSQENTLPDGRQEYKTFRDDVNLYSHTAVKKLIQNVAELLELSTTEVSSTIAELTEELEAYRMGERAMQIQALKPKQYEMTQTEVRAAQAFLKGENLVKKTLELISKSGLVGEQKNGLMLFFLYLSRLQDEPLHAIIFGKSGSGKTYLQKRISECLPEEAVRTVTSLTENTLYYSAKNFWKHKVLLIEDLEGVYQAFLPLREFMSNQSISKLTTDKDAKGNNVQKVLTVEGPICVSGATTKESIYEDNANRSFLLHIDESPNHLNEVMTYQRKMKADLINETEQDDAKQLLKNTQRILHNIRVVNPYAMDLKIPDMVFKKLRTNMHYLKLIEIITFYHQCQRHRHKDKNGKPFIKTEIIDIEWANWLVKETLLRKSDELSGDNRQFFERLKTAVPEGQSFYNKQIRESFRMNRMSVNRHLRNLEGMGYLEQTGGNRKQGFEYVIKSYVEYDQLKKGIDILDENLTQLKLSLPAGQAGVTAKKEEKPSVTPV